MDSASAPRALIGAGCLSLESLYKVSALDLSIDAEP
jgi:hypothetical protein